MRTNLSKDALKALNAYKTQQAKNNNLPVEYLDGGAFFKVIPEVEHKWIDGVQSAHDFLEQIRMETGPTQVVNSLDMAEVGLVSGRTNTDEEDRKTTSLAGVSGVEYIARATDHDTHISFAELNKWSRRNRDKFQLFVQKRRTASKANDIVKIGWHGKEAAAVTNKEKNPLGQDVNIGWIERVRQNKSDNIIDGAANNITIGEGGTYESLDAAVIALKAQIPKHKQKGLKLFASAEFFEDRAMRLVEKQTITEAGEGKLLQAEYLLAGGIIGETPDYFPDNTLILTNPKNLVFYTQEGSVRQGMRENHPRSRQEHYLQSNEFYAVGDYEAIIILENALVNRGDE